MLTTEAKREIAACAIGIAGAVLFLLVIPAMLAPAPGPAAPRMAPIEYRVDEQMPARSTETWEAYAARMKAQDKPFSR